MAETPEEKKAREKKEAEAKAAASPSPSPSPSPGEGHLFTAPKNQGQRFSVDSRGRRTALASDQAEAIEEKEPSLASIAKKVEDFNEPINKYPSYAKWKEARDAWRAAHKK